MDKRLQMTLPPPAPRFSPANCHVEGRAAERERGALVMLAPGQVMEYLLTLTILEE